MAHEQHKVPNTESHHEYKDGSYVAADYDPAEHEFPKWIDGILHASKKAYDIFKANAEARAKEAKDGKKADPLVVKGT